ncbi:MAG TPA: MlaD family protein [Thermoanaerobaculia bacterium]|nr:MlaD family protein [Thermoanaerobaculia bacterium]
MTDDRQRAARVGLLVVVSLAVAALGIFLIGQQNDLFRRKVSYYAVFPRVEGLAEGNPVQLDGVKVGSIGHVILPENVGESGIRVEVSLDRRFRNRIRTDSEARIQTIGLLGDKYIELRSGTPAGTVLEEGAEIKTAPPSAVETLMQSGQDMVTNIAEISASLRSIMDRLNRGEGLVGELMSNAATGRRVTDTLVDTLDSVKEVAGKIEHGEGVLPRLITDRQLATRLVATLERVDSLVARYDSDQGLLPALASDAATRKSFIETLSSLESSAKNLSAITAEIKEGQGLLQKLLLDKQYGEATPQQVSDLLTRLDRLTQALETGNGTAARLIHDPELYQALKDIVSGVNQSRLLKWAIRNRQKAGAEHRLEEESKAPPR